MKDDSIISIQDMGAAGLTSSSVEMAAKGNLGIEINLNKIPCREDQYVSLRNDALRKSRKNVVDIKIWQRKKCEKKFSINGISDFSIIGRNNKFKKLSIKL